MGGKLIKIRLEGRRAGTQACLDLSLSCLVLIGLWTISFPFWELNLLTPCILPRLAPCFFSSVSMSTTKSEKFLELHGFLGEAEDPEVFVIRRHDAPGSCSVSLPSCLPHASLNNQKHLFGGFLPGRGRAVTNLACSCFISGQPGCPLGSPPAASAEATCSVVEPWFWRRGMPSTWVQREG